MFYLDNLFKNNINVKKAQKKKLKTIADALLE